MLKLKLQYFGHLMQRVDSLEKTLMLGGIGGRTLSKLKRRLDSLEAAQGAPRSESSPMSQLFA